MPAIRAIHADISTLSVAAIVETCSQWSGLQTGQAGIDDGCGCKARDVIHTVVPAWRNGECGEVAELAGCYRACIAVAEENNIESIAFPAFCGGENDFPPALACEIAVNTVCIAVEGTAVIAEVIFCCCSRVALSQYRSVLMQPS